jgi:hypothetical protein
MTPVLWDVLPLELPRRRQRLRGFIAPAQRRPKGGPAVGHVAEVALAAQAGGFEAHEPAVEVVVIDALDAAQEAAVGRLASSTPISICGGGGDRVDTTHLAHSGLRTDSA